MECVTDLGEHVVTRSGLWCAMSISFFFVYMYMDARSALKVGGTHADPLVARIGASEKSGHSYQTDLHIVIIRIIASDKAFINRTIMLTRDPHKECLLSRSLLFSFSSRSLTQRLEIACSRYSTNYVFLLYM